MLNNFCVFKERVFFDLWILDSGFRIPDSGFRIPDSGFRFPGFRVALFFSGASEGPQRDNSNEGPEGPSH